MHLATIRTISYFFEDALSPVFFYKDVLLVVLTRQLLVSLESHVVGTVLVLSQTLVRIDGHRQLVNCCRWNLSILLFRVTQRNLRVSLLQIDRVCWTFYFGKSTDSEVSAALKIRRIVQLTQLFCRSSKRFFSSTTIIELKHLHFIRRTD